MVAAAPASAASVGDLLQAFRECWSRLTLQQRLAMRPPERPDAHEDMTLLQPPRMLPSGEAILLQGSRKCSLRLHDAFDMVPARTAFPAARLEYSHATRRLFIAKLTTSAPCIVLLHARFQGGEVTRSIIQPCDQQLILPFQVAEAWSFCDLAWSLIFMQ